MVVRQAHPGPGVRPYRTQQEKSDDARRYQEEDGIAWSVLVDDLPGSVHQVYGCLADPTYLIDADGRVAYYNMWTHAPTLHRAIQALMQNGGRGTVLGGIDHTPHMLATLTNGWKGLRRGTPQSYLDIETAAPGMGSGIWLGYHMRPLLAPIALRAQPLPVSAKIAIGIGAAAVVGSAIYGLVRRFSR